MEMAAQSRVHGGRICIAVRANAGAENAEDGFKRGARRDRRASSWKIPGALCALGVSDRLCVLSFRAVRRTGRGERRVAEDGFNAEFAEIAERLPGKIPAPCARSAFRDELIEPEQARSARHRRDHSHGHVSDLRSVICGHERLLDVRHGRPPELDAGVPPWLELSLHMANRTASDTQSRDERARGIDCPSRFRRASTSRRLIDAAAMT